jgi:hypothetical protein
VLHPYPTSKDVKTCFFTHALSPKATFFACNQSLMGLPRVQQAPEENLSSDSVQHTLILARKRYCNKLKQPPQIQQGRIQDSSVRRFHVEFVFQIFYFSTVVTRCTVALSIDIRSNAVEDVWSNG